MSLTLPELDQQTAEELRPACDVREAFVPGFGRALVWRTDAAPGWVCPSPAAWIARATCPVCGVLEVVLFCEAHQVRAAADTVLWLCDCRVPYPWCRVTWERL